MEEKYTNGIVAAFIDALENYHANSNTELPEVITAEETAGILRINIKTVRELYHRGELPGRKLGPKILRFHRQTVLSWLREGGNSRRRKKQ